ncbi:class I SAM-dependent methyltransferase [Paenibacillus sp. P96]|uniref:Class I SAM-dependent methyltransferase n=1 Tax=Paenibacillus zeirhizosphaerae TaxID=2987519 RepID=A0ABT9FXT8_9BACL|nr:methyltransferase domain-containing protein [Paenibacillus sp. P96]MDP4099282.1 class I SAM-dependent methyltransferase [Paenibacillus sp. P96]
MSIPEGNLLSNIERFSGFADGYDRSRPQAPSVVPELIIRYLRRRPALVADVGCGTGLSTLLWRNCAEEVVGIEPNADMLAVAREKLADSKDTYQISFEHGFSNALPCADESVDVVTCSQSFHWMEPASTLEEIRRVLVPGGVFAAYDCDWPLSLEWEAEAAYNRIITKAEDIVKRLAPEEQQAHKWDKNTHLERMTASGVFRFTKEIVFHHYEPCDADRYVRLALSQGGVQTVFKLGSSELDEDLVRFSALVGKAFAGKTLDLMFSYRMRLGIK